MNETQTPLRHIETLAYSRGVTPVFVEGGGIAFNVWTDERFAINSFWLPRNDMLGFVVASPNYPVPRSSRYGDALALFGTINNVLKGRHQFHWYAEGWFKVGNQRAPVYQVCLHEASRQSLPQVEMFVGNLIGQFEEVLPIFVAAHANDFLPGPQWVELALSPNGRYRN